MFSPESQRNQQFSSDEEKEPEETPSTAKDPPGAVGRSWSRVKTTFYYLLFFAADNVAQALVADCSSGSNRKVLFIYLCKEQQIWFLENSIQKISQKAKFSGNEFFFARLVLSYTIHIYFSFAKTLRRDIKFFVVFSRVIFFTHNEH